LPVSHQDIAALRQDVPDPERLEHIKSAFRYIRANMLKKEQVNMASVQHFWFSSMGHWDA
jgi:hypothetical protein